MTSRSALPMVLSSWSSLFSVLALRSRMIRPEAVKNLTGMPRLQARVPMAMARWGPARMPASSVEHEVLGAVDELEGDELFASPVGGERGHAPGRTRQVLWIGGSRPV